MEWYHSPTYKMLVAKWDKAFPTKPPPKCCVLKTHLCSFCMLLLALRRKCSSSFLLDESHESNLAVLRLLKLWGCCLSTEHQCQTALPCWSVPSCCPHIIHRADWLLMGGFPLCMPPAGQGPHPSKGLKKQFEQNQHASQQVSGSLMFTEHRHLTCHEHKHGNALKTCSSK